MPGIDDVARRAGVSTATVSRALSGNGPVSQTTRARVVQAASDLGYVVSSDASSLASGRTRNIGAVVPHLNRWFFTNYQQFRNGTYPVQASYRMVQALLGLKAAVEKAKKAGKSKK